MSDMTPAQIAEARARIEGGDPDYQGARDMLIEIGRRETNLRLPPSQDAHLLRRIGLATSKPITRGPQDGTRRYSLTLDGKAIYERIK